MTASVPTLAPPAGAPVPVHFTLYGRGYCHLCDDMLAALLALQTEQQRFTVDVIDVDADPALVARFDELVPVLFGDLSEPELCHYFLDAQAVGRWLASRSVSI